MLHVAHAHKMFRSRPVATASCCSSWPILLQQHQKTAPTALLPILAGKPRKRCLGLWSGHCSWRLHMPGRTAGVLQQPCQPEMAQRQFGRICWCHDVRMPVVVFVVGPVEALRQPDGSGTHAPHVCRPSPPVSRGLPVHSTNHLPVHSTNHVLLCCSLPLIAMQLRVLCGDPVHQGSCRV